MAADRVETDLRMRKFHAGWVYHQVGRSKKKYWIVLRGHMLFIFKGEKTMKENMVGSLTLNSNTEIRTEDADKKMKKKDITSLTVITNNNSDKKVNIFKFDTENDRDLWKSFLIAITKGIVPSDVHLLPGQLRDVHEVIGDQNKPPPLPSTTIPRPRLIAEPASPGGGGFDDAPSFTNGYRSRSAGGEDSSDSGSFSSHMTRNPQLETQWSVTSSGAPVRSLRDLQRRQSETNDRDLGFVEDGSSFGGHAPFVGRQSSNQSHLSQESSHSVMSYAANNNNEIHLFYWDAARNRDVPSWFFESCDRTQAESLLTANRKFGNVLLRPSTTFPENHKYVISMRRDVSGGTNLNHYEVIRGSDGYVINVDNKHGAMRCLSEVMDYFITVAGPSAQPMKCNNIAKMDGVPAFNTQPAMNFNSSGFDTVSGVSDNHWQDTMLPSSGNVTPGGRHTLADLNRDFEQRTMQAPPPSPSIPSQSGRSEFSSARSELNGSRTLCIQGNVTPGIRQTILEINEDLEQHLPVSPPPSALFTPTQNYNAESYGNNTAHPTAGYYGMANGQQKTHETASVYNAGQQRSQPSTPNRWGAPTTPISPTATRWGVPTTPVSPTATRWGAPTTPVSPIGHQPGPYENVSEWQGNGQQADYNSGGLNRTVPARHTPLETLQRQAGHVTDIYRGMATMSMNPNDNFPSEQAPPPPPVPSGRPTVPFNTIPTSPMQQPPQMGFGSPQYPRMGYASPTMQQPSYNTSPPGAAPGRGMFGGALSFEDELSKRMVRQKEQIYASGATVLRSGNWD